MANPLFIQITASDRNPAGPVPVSVARKAAELMAGVDSIVRHRAEAAAGETNDALVARCAL